MAQSFSSFVLVYVVGVNYIRKYTDTYNENRKPEFKQSDRATMNE